MSLETRECGAIHPSGQVCCRNIWVEPGCCHEKVYNHEGPHQAMDKDKNITHRWTATLVVRDEPFDAYGPLEDDVPVGYDPPRKKVKEVA